MLATPRLLEFFGDGEEFRDGIPVASGDGDFHDAVDGGPSQIGAADAIGKIDIKLARCEVDFLGAGGDGAKFGAGFWSRLLCHKTNEKFAVIDVAALGERVARDDLAQFIGCSVNDARAEAEFAFNSVLDAFGKSGEVALASAKDDVAAINIGLAAGEFERFVKSAKGIHFDLIAPGDVDAA